MSLWEETHGLRTHYIQAYISRSKMATPHRIACVLTINVARWDPHENMLFSSIHMEHQGQVGEDTAVVDAILGASEVVGTALVAHESSLSLPSSAGYTRLPFLSMASSSLPCLPRHGLLPSSFSISSFLFRFTCSLHP